MEILQSALWDRAASTRVRTKLSRTPGQQPTSFFHKLTVQKPLTNPLDLLRRRPRPRHQHLNHALQRPSPIIPLAAPKVQPHALVRLGQRPEGGRDVAGDGDRVVVGDGARVDVLEGGEEGGEVRAPGRMGAGLGRGGFGDVVLDWSRLVGGGFIFCVGPGGGGMGRSGVEYFRRMPCFVEGGVWFIVGVVRSREW